MSSCSGASVIQMLDRLEPPHLVQLRVALGMTSLQHVRRITQFIGDGGQAKRLHHAPAGNYALHVDGPQHLFGI